ncbi:MAG: type II secretion system protein [Planctomycetes bacterium]|nr:type II secretion system protein [Planctomycetota bacterium]
MTYSSTNRPAGRWSRRAFTLAELLVVMAIIGILATVTVVAVGRITDDARISSAINTVTAGLDNARAFAIKRNRVVMAVFRVRSDSPREQFTEMVLAEWSGESVVVDCDGFFEVRDRFVPLPDVRPRALPPGIKVAGAWYDVDDDDVWVTQPEVALTDPTDPNAECDCSRMLGMIFAPDGSIVTFNPASNGDDSWVDFDLNGEQYTSPDGCGRPPWVYDEADDEPKVEPVPFLAVYDDKLAREAKSIAWTSEDGYQDELSGPEGYITRNADRLYFNRYSGVLMR